VIRRFISGRPVFYADREHIHHKLLQRGLSHRQVVIVLYAVRPCLACSACFCCGLRAVPSDLFWPYLAPESGWGVQHLGYLEFGEIRRVAQRTIEQRQISLTTLPFAGPRKS